jgi:hypothetical protein
MTGYSLSINPYETEIILEEDTKQFVLNITNLIPIFLLCGS